MPVSGETILVKREVEEGGNTQAVMVLNAVYTALKEAGHNPTVQLVGYLVSGEPTYITSKHDARKLVSSIERDELVEELVRFFDMRIMSLDVGSQTIGVAVSDLFGWTAQGVETIRHTTREKDFVRLRHLADEYNVEEFVIGMPLNMNGTKGMRAEQTEKFAEALAAAFPDIPYHFWDERLTTVMAQRQLIEADVSRKKRKKVIDKMAAVVILEGYLQHLSFKNRG